MERRKWIIGSAIALAGIVFCVSGFLLPGIVMFLGGAVASPIPDMLLLEAGIVADWKVSVITGAAIMLLGILMTLPALAKHDHIAGEWITDEAAGYMYRKCESCGEIMERKDLNAAPLQTLEDAPEESEEEAGEEDIGDAEEEGYLASLKLKEKKGMNGAFLYAVADREKAFSTSTEDFNAFAEKVAMETADAGCTLAYLVFRDKTAIEFDMGLFSGTDMVYGEFDKETYSIQKKLGTIRLKDGYYVLDELEDESGEEDAGASTVSPSGMSGNDTSAEDYMKENAEEQAREIIRDANAEAEKIVEDAKKEAEQEKNAARKEAQQAAQAMQEDQQPVQEDQSQEQGAELQGGEAEDHGDSQGSWSEGS